MGSTILFRRGFRAQVAPPAPRATKQTQNRPRVCSGASQGLLIASRALDFGKQQCSPCPTGQKGSPSHRGRGAARPASGRQMGRERGEAAPAGAGGKESSQPSSWQRRRLGRAPGNAGLLRAFLQMSLFTKRGGDEMQKHRGAFVRIARKGVRALKLLPWCF